MDEVDGSAKTVLAEQDSPKNSGVGVQSTLGDPDACCAAGGVTWCVLMTSGFPKCWGMSGVMVATCRGWRGVTTRPRSSARPHADRHQATANVTPAGSSPHRPVGQQFLRRLDAQCQRRSLVVHDRKQEALRIGMTGVRRASVARARAHRHRSWSLCRSPCPQLFQRGIEPRGLDALQAGEQTCLSFGFGSQVE